MEKELAKYSFLKSTEQLESKGFVFSLFLKESEKSARGSRGEDGRIERDENIGDGSMDIDYCQ